MEIILNKSKKQITFIYLFLPFLLSSLCFFAVYGSGLAYQYETYNQIISSSFPDYIIVKENSSIFQNSAYNQTIVKNSFALKDYSHIGFFRCSSILGFFVPKNFIIITAPSDYYHTYTNLSLSYKDIFLEGSLRNEFFNSSKEIFSTFTITNNLTINFSLNIAGFIQKSDFFVNQEFQQILKSKVSNKEKCLFMTDDTFEKLFLEHLKKIRFFEIYIFQFRRDKIFSQPVTKIESYLQSLENKLNLYFGYNSQENTESYQNLSLRMQLYFFNLNYSDVNFLQMTFLFSLVTIFSLVFISYSTDTFITNQQENITFFRIRGGKRADIYKYYLRKELKILLVVSIVSYIASLVFLHLITPSFLKFSMNYLRVFGSLITFNLCTGAFQITSIIRTLGKKQIISSSEITLLQRFKGIVKDLILLSIPIILFTAILLLFIAVSWDFEQNYKIWVIILVVVFLTFLYLLVLKDKLLLFGIFIISILGKKILIFKYARALSYKVLSKKLKLSKITIMFILILSFAFSFSDSFRASKIKSRDFNNIGDLIITYPASSLVEVQQSLTEYVNLSIEFNQIQFTKRIHPPGETYDLDLGIDGFIINQTKIEYLLKDKKFVDGYSGRIGLEGIRTEFIIENKSVVISKDLADNIQAEINEDFFFPFKNSQYQISAKIIDIVSITPIFSWITKFYEIGNSYSSTANYILLNSNFNENFSLENYGKLFSILYLEDSSKVVSIKERIGVLNREKHLGIKILDFQKFNIIDNDYLRVIIQPKFLIFIVIVLSISLCFFIVDYSYYLYNEFLQGFKVFFSRGISIKTGIFLAVSPILIFLLYLIVIGNVFGWFLSFIVFSQFQSPSYLKPCLSIYPSSLMVLCCQLSIVILITFYIILQSFKNLKQNIPVIEKEVDTIINLENV
ncbi:MAG: hypothetical protein ACTSP3_03155 [Candidatus Heimdallarchaeaceae archaeon]